MKEESSYGNPGYAEYLYPVKSNSKIKLIRAIIILAGLLFSLLFAGIMSKIPQIFVMWILADVFFCFMGFTYTKREFEYIISTGTLELSCIYGKRKRKKICEIPLKNVTHAKYIASLNDEPHDNIIYACDNKDGFKCLIEYTTNNDKSSFLVISCPNKVLSCIRYYNRAAVDTVDTSR